MNKSTKKRIEELWENLLAAIPNKRGSVFIEYCEENILQERGGNLTIAEASYNICRACSYSFDNLISLQHKKIMDIACDLELPNEYRERSTDDWEELKRLVTSLSISQPDNQ